MTGVVVSRLVQGKVWLCIDHESVRQGATLMSPDAVSSSDMNSCAARCCQHVREYAPRRTPTGGDGSHSEVRAIADVATRVDSGMTGAAVIVHDYQAARIAGDAERREPGGWFRLLAQRQDYRVASDVVVVRRRTVATAQHQHMMTVQIGRFHDITEVMGVERREV